MPFEHLEFPGLKIYQPRVFEDKRGYFFESYNEREFTDNGVTNRFVQDNRSRSVKGVLRGLHYQLNPMAQAKLVTVLQGSVQDIVVDIRRGSPSYLRSYSIVLSEENKTQLYIPRGFAHGFLVLSDIAEFYYKCDGFYSKEQERGIRFDDPSLDITWELPDEELIVSEKDNILPFIADAEYNFEYNPQAP